MKHCIAFCLLFFSWWAAQAQNPPVAVNDTVIVPKNSNNTLSVTQNDTNFAAGSMTVRIVTTPTRGLASVINGNQVNYVPTPLYFGRDSFRYSICDVNSLCDTASVYLIIIGSNSPPKAWEDEFVIAEGQDTTQLDVLANDTDAEGDTLFVLSVFTQGADTSLGQILFDSLTGKITFVRKPLSCGNSKFSYLLCDPSGCDTGQAVVYVYCPGNIFVPEGFSPNGDGKNDQLVFKDLEYFGPATIHIFNRYGTSVYESNDYKNDWDGTTSLSGRTLPDGTYFYVLQLIDKRKYSGYLIINR